MLFNNGDNNTGEIFIYIWPTDLSTTFKKLESHRTYINNVKAETLVKY